MISGSRNNSRVWISRSTNNTFHQPSSIKVSYHNRDEVIILLRTEKFYWNVVVFSKTNDKFSDGIFFNIIKSDIRILLYECFNYICKNGFKLNIHSGLVPWVMYLVFNLLFYAWNSKGEVEYHGQPLKSANN